MSAIIKMWGLRRLESMNQRGQFTESNEVCMAAEITELRAALADRQVAAPVDPSMWVILHDGKSVQSDKLMRADAEQVVAAEALFAALEAERLELEARTPPLCPECQAREAGAFDPLAPVSDLRAQFEAKYGPKDSFAWKNEDGSYKVTSMQMSWEYFQAGAATQPPLPDHERAAGKDGA